MSMVFAGPAGVAAFRAAQIKNMLRQYALTGEARPGVTSGGLLKAAAEITGQKFKRGEYLKAADAIDAWLAVNSATGR
jgi:hypothetical protein